jgi:ATP-dependent DNA helicase RecG
MHGKAAYTHSKGIDAIRYKELVRQFIVDHGSITPKECRELLGFGESRTAKSAISRLLTEWSADDGILRPEGFTANRKYFLRDERGEARNG